MDPASRQLQQHLAVAGATAAGANAQDLRPAQHLGLARAMSCWRPSKPRPELPTRAHLAEALRAGGHVSRTDDAFRKYLGKGKAAHLAADWPALAEVVGWIRAAGGVASLAHPARYALSAGARRQLLAEFAAAGGGALEVVTGGNGAHHVEASAMLAVKYGLAGSIGSDFHDPQQVWNPLGRLAKLPDAVIPVWRAIRPLNSNKQDDKSSQPQ